MCQLHPEVCEVGDLIHHLVLCPTLSARRDVLFVYWDEISTKSLPCREIFNWAKSAKNEDFLQFILNCSILTVVITAVPSNGNFVLHTLLKGTRTYAYSMFRLKKRLLGWWSAVT